MESNHVELKLARNYKKNILLRHLRKEAEIQDQGWNLNFAWSSLFRLPSLDDWTPVSKPGWRG